MTETYDVAEIKARLVAKMGKHAGHYPAALEQFSPRILAEIASLWGSAGLDLYLEHLMLPERQDRQGFPLAVATALLNLSTVHGALGLAPRSRGTSWWSALIESTRADRPAGQ